MTVEEKRRELFERDIHAQASRRNEVGDYVLPSIQDRWAGFNAALDDIEIELPSGFTHHTGADYTAYVMDADEAPKKTEQQLKLEELEATIQKAQQEIQKASAEVQALKEMK